MYLAVLIFLYDPLDEPVDCEVQELLAVSRHEVFQQRASETIAAENVVTLRVRQGVAFQVVQKERVCEWREV